MGRSVLRVVLGFVVAAPAAENGSGPVPGLTTSDEMAVTGNGDNVWGEGYFSNFRPDQVPEWFLSQEDTRPIVLKGFDAQHLVETVTFNHQPRRKT